MPEKQYFFNINTQFENVGDALINRELIHEALNHGNVVVDLSRCPEDFKKMLALKPDVLLSNGLLSTLVKLTSYRLNNCEVYYFLNPGGLGQKLNLKGRVNSLLYTFILSLIRIIGVRIVHVGMSYNNINKLDILLARTRNKLLYKTFPRDTDSYSLLIDNKFKLNGIYPDLAFFSTPPVNVKSDGYILFSFRLDAEYSNSINFYINLIETVIEKMPEKKIVFYSQVQRDNKCMRDLNELFQAKAKTQLILTTDCIEKSVGHIKASHMIFSNRLHVLLLGWSQGVIPIACLKPNQGGKIKAIYNDAGVRKFILNETDQLLGILELDNKLLINSFKEQHNKIKTLFTEEL